MKNFNQITGKLTGLPTQLTISETVKITYKVIANKNPYAQKTVSATVSNNSNAISQFEEKVREKFGDDIKFNHAGKVVIL